MATSRVEPKRGCVQRDFQNRNEHTGLAANGYALFKRPNDGKMEAVKDGKTVVTNRDIVPYSRYFLEKFHTHINIEHCSSVEWVNYVI